MGDRTPRFVILIPKSPRISAYEIHEYIHDALYVSEATVTMIKIDGPRLQVFTNFVDLRHSHDIIQTNQGTAKCKHSSGELSIVRIVWLEWGQNVYA